MAQLIINDYEFCAGLNFKDRIFMERTAPDRLVITTESDNGEPLLYALRQCFEILKIEFNVLN